MSGTVPAPTDFEQRRLSRLRLLNVLDTPPEPVFDALVRIAASICGTPIALVSLIDTDRQWFKANLGLEGTPETPRAVAFCDHTIRGDEVMEIGDATTDARFRENPLVTGDPNIRFYAGAPIVMPTGERVGSLCVIDREPRELSPSQRRNLADLAVVVQWALTRRERNHDLTVVELLSSVLENIPCGVAVFDAGLRLTAHNRQFPQLLDFPESLFSSSEPRFEDFIRYNAQRGEFGPGDVDTIVGDIVKWARDPAPHHTQRTRPGGATLEIRGAPMPGGGFVNTYIDVSPAKAAELALRESEERQARALDASRLALWDLHVASGKLYLSANWSEMLGGAKESMVTTLQALMARVPPEEQELVSQAFGAVLKGTRDTYSVEHRVTRDDGSTWWIRSEGKVTQRDAQGRALQMTGTNQDISARKAIDAELEQARLAAEEANRAKTDFLHNVSHEIRTPLNGVIGMTRMLLSENLTPRQRQYAELANTSASSLLGLINDLLDLGKIEAGKLELEEVSFDLHALLGEVGQLYRLSAREKDLAFSLDIAPGVPAQVTGDSGRLRQILNNFLSNALKFTAAGGVALGVARAGSGAMLRFTVSDTGVGIPAAVQHKLFDRFTQADTSTTRKYGGTGLGLAIVKRLCEQMGGSVRLDSSEGRGSTFTCDLPLAAAAAAQSLPAAARPLEPPTGRALRILLAEDNPTNQLVAQGMLALAGYHDVTTVEDGQQAVAAVERGGIDIVFMDCRMPRLDGYEATTRLREAGHTLPIIALTANATADERERCLAHGMNDFLSKPIDEAKLADAIARWASGTPVAAPTPSPEAPASRAPFSRAAALEQLSGDEELLAVVLASFRQHGPALLTKASEALAAQDAKALHRHLHSLKGSAGTLGAKSLADLAKALEALAADGRMNDVQARLGELESALADFLGAAASW
ncbi:PAS-domain containing protein [Caenimonas aquaedulcis]|uniref:histidine kinase n=1 Tax=Caenimonas aquaedulcis TaxID=2793270 RepID=A0A931H7W2_9BURK|nr:PAS-domain containing protein [Caenimonas aquaedulcis]MBG9390336.1 PAS-domain containing protein [Caenimonas aquaedulcis]